MVNRAEQDYSLWTVYHLSITVAGFVTSHMHETADTYFKSSLLFVILNGRVFKYGFVHVCSANGSQKRVEFPGDGVTDICEPPDVGAWSQMCPAIFPASFSRPLCLKHGLRSSYFELIFF